MQVAVTFHSNAIEHSSISLCSTILKAIASLLFFRSPANHNKIVDEIPTTATSTASSITSFTSNVLCTNLISQNSYITTLNTACFANHNNNQTQNTTSTNTTQQKREQSQEQSQQHQSINNQHHVIRSTSSSLSFYVTTTQPSSTFSFYTCSSCDSASMNSSSIESQPFIPCSSSASFATTIAKFQSTFDNSSAGHFKPFSLNVNAYHLDDTRVYRRLLVQLEETERRFDDFWNTHLIRLKQCLDLRRFELDFRELQVCCYSKFHTHRKIFE